MSSVKRVEIIPTCVPMSERDLEACEKAISSFADWIHVDVGDGAFSPVATWPYRAQGVVGEFDLSRLWGLSVEAHLMVEEPRELGLRFARTGAFRVVGHVEAFGDTTEAYGALDSWRRAGAEAGLGILLHTPFEVIEPLVAACDFVHMMTISSIGTQGIPYEPSAPERIAEFHARFPDTLISVDGGVSESNIADLVRAGARRFGVGSAISKSANPAAAYEALKALAESAIV